MTILKAIRFLSVSIFLPLWLLILATDYSDVESNLNSWKVPFYSALVENVTLIALSSVLIAFLIVIVEYFHNKNKIKLKLKRDIYLLVNDIDIFISEYEIRLNDASWKPHLGGNDRVEKTLETDKINAEINEKFGRCFKSRSTHLLHDAYPYVDRNELNKEIKTIDGPYSIKLFSLKMSNVANQL